MNPTKEWKHYPCLIAPSTFMLFPSLLLIKSYPKRVQAQFTFSLSGEPPNAPFKKHELVQCLLKVWTPAEGLIWKLFNTGPEWIRSLSQNINQRYHSEHCLVSWKQGVDLHSGTGSLSHQRPALWEAWNSLISKVQANSQSLDFLIV